MFFSCLLFGLLITWFVIFHRYLEVFLDIFASSASLKSLWLGTEVWSIMRCFGRIIGINRNLSRDYQEIPVWCVALKKICGWCCRQWNRWFRCLNPALIHDLWSALLFGQPGQRCCCWTSMLGESIWKPFDSEVVLHFWLSIYWNRFVTLEVSLSSRDIFVADGLISLGLVPICRVLFLCGLFG